MHKKKIQFFSKLSDDFTALTYDDVRLRTAKSRYSPKDININSKFSKNVGLKAPIVSAAMDTVTTSDMAIAMAKLGGIGVIHASLTPENQRKEVRRVKLHMNGLVEHPVTVNSIHTVKEVLELCEKNNFDFRTFPVVDNSGKLKGLLTQNDIDFCDDPNQTIGSVMTPYSEIISSAPGTSINEAHELMKKHKKKTLPLVDDNNNIHGMYILSDVLRIVGGNPKQYNLDRNGRLRVAAAVTTDPDDAVERIAGMADYIDVVVVDTAQGDSMYALLTLKRIKSAFPGIDVVVGNVSEPDSARMLAEAGADGIKVGQGPGSICTTRPETGIGSPQVTAVYECTRAVEKFGVPICADGGITNPGDISIAIAAGAHSVMLGGLLAGTKETPGDVITRDGDMYKLYRGMGSLSALQESSASRRRYSVELKAGKPLVEGIEKLVIYRGSVKDAVNHYVSALKKSMSYVGAGNLEDHRQNTQLIRITNAGMRESLPHDVSHS